MHCPRCNAVVTVEGAHFCDSCGQSLDVQPTLSQEQTEQFQSVSATVETTFDKGAPFTASTTDSVEVERKILPTSLLTLADALEYIGASVATVCALCMNITVLGIWLFSPEALGNITKIMQLLVMTLQSSMSVETTMLYPISTGLGSLHMVVSVLSIILLIAFISIVASIIAHCFGYVWSRFVLAGACLLFAIAGITNVVIAGKLSDTLVGVLQLNNASSNEMAILLRSLSGASLVSVNASTWVLIASALVTVVMIFLHKTLVTHTVLGQSVVTKHADEVDK